MGPPALRRVVFTDFRDERRDRGRAISSRILTFYGYGLDYLVAVERQIDRLQRLVFKDARRRIFAGFDINGRYVVRVVYKTGALLAVTLWLLSAAVAHAWDNPEHPSCPPQEQLSVFLGDHTENLISLDPRFDTTSRDSSKSVLRIRIDTIVHSPLQPTPLSNQAGTSATAIASVLEVIKGAMPLTQLKIAVGNRCIATFHVGEVGIVAGYFFEIDPRLATFIPRSAVPSDNF